MARPKHDPQRDTRQAILDAALECFAERGFHGVSVREIARAVGVRESGLYHHFGSKEALFDAVLFETDADERLMLGPPKLPEFEGDAVGLQGFLEAMVATVTSRYEAPRERKRFRILLSDGLRLAAAGRIDYVERAMAMRQPLVTLMASLMARGLLRPEPPAVVAMQFVGPLLIWRHLIAMDLDGVLPFDRVAYTRLHVQRFLRGSLTPEAAEVIAQAGAAAAPTMATQGDA